MVAPGARAWGALLRRSRRTRPRGRWLILAPHPDDETLGAGGLIAALAAAGRPPTIVFLTDGAGSHVGAPGWSDARVARARRGEAGHALRQLGVVAAPIHLDWPDAAPPDSRSVAFARGVAALATVCRRHRIDHIAATWVGEPHCDHEAAARLARAVAQRCRLRLYDYLVWGWTRGDLCDAIDARKIIAIDTAAHRPAQRRAMARHRTQRGGRIAGGVSFRLPRAMLRLVDRPVTLLLERRHAT